MTPPSSPVPEALSGSLGVNSSFPAGDPTLRPAALPEFIVEDYSGGSELTLRPTQSGFVRCQATNHRGTDSHQKLVTVTGTQRELKHASVEVRPCRHGLLPEWDFCIGCRAVVLSWRQKLHHWILR